MPQADDSPSSRRAQRPFPELPAILSLPAIEHEVLGRWTAGKVFQRSLEQTSGGPRWTCYECPPTASGMPGVHHVPARAIKDLFPRFKTMQGFHVPRRGGWDCHGLPVEVAVEKELGLSGRKDIEAYGVEQFNARCRESVLRHVGAFAELTERMGYWRDLSQAYRTMDQAYIESVWWSLKRIFHAGLLVRDYRISPYCPRCETPLSDHELGQPDVYQTVTDPSVTVRFPLLALPDGAHPQLRGADLLVWTAMPWTLVSNTAVAVHPDKKYAVARRAGHDDRVIVADAAFARVLGDGWHVVARVSGAELAGARYQPAFSLVEVPGEHRVVTGSFVSTAEGTGLAHLAPAFGAEDMEAGRTHGLGIVNPIGLDGRFDEQIPFVGGTFFKDADPLLIASLADRNVLFATSRHEHSDPHCWRCGTPLLNYALRSWYIRTTAIKDLLLAQNQKTSWRPAKVKHGHYGDWLRGNEDWTLSRTRYWGTPLPLWECEQGHVTCAGSLAELSELAGRDLTGLDPHRPHVDSVIIRCPRCGTHGHRVPEVIDVWYDSGSMPFAQHGTPPQAGTDFDDGFPAQLVAEGIDQTRGWFYALMAIGTLLFGRSAFESALCLGAVVDEHGRKMSKSLGNVIEPMSLMERHGADAVRWFFTASAPTWATQKVSHAAIDEIVGKVLLAYWGTVSFIVRHANAAAAQGTIWQPGAAGTPPPATRPVLDRWLLSELHTLVRDVTVALEAFDSATAGRRIASFIDEASGWYVRRSRRRFLGGPAGQDGAAAFATLYEGLETLTRLMAPFTPFLTDYAWGVLAPGHAADSVHLASWPIADPALIDERLAGQVALTRRLAELGRSARAAAAVKASQPLARALVDAAGFEYLPAELRTQVADELNVRALEPLLACDDVALAQVPRSGWAVTTGEGETVALDLVITPGLRREGLAREVLHTIQDARKDAGLDAGDRISLRLSTTDTELAAALDEYGPMISAGVQATDYKISAAGNDRSYPWKHVADSLALTFWFRLAD